MFLPDNARLARRGHQDLRLTALARQVRRPGVADGAGGVAAQQHHGHRLAHHQAPAHHRDPFAPELAAEVVQNFQHGLGGAGGIPRPLAGKDRRQGTAGDAVHVLFGPQRFTYRPLIQMLGQRAEQ